MKLKERFFNYIKHEKRYSAHTVRAYTDDILSFLSFYGDQQEPDFTKVTSTDIRMWLVELANQKISPRTYKRKLSSIKALFKFLLREGVIIKNPTDLVIMPKHQNPLPEFFNLKETQNLFDYVTFNPGFEGVRDKLIISLFYNTGMRLSELVSLRLSDIDFGMQHIKVTGKRNKQRHLPITTSLQSEITVYLKLREETFQAVGTDRVFLTKRGLPVYERFVQRLVGTYMAQVTTSEKTNPHKLRHTFATHMLNSGADLNAVKELLGHSSLAATEIYTHNTYEKLKSVYKQAHPRA